MAAKSGLSASQEAEITQWLGRKWSAVLGVIGGWPTVLTVGGGLIVVKFLLDSYGISMGGVLWLILALVLWGLRWQGSLQLWAFQRRRLLAKHSTPAPGQVQMLRDLAQHKRRVAYVREQWLAFCDRPEFKGNHGAIPKLGWIKPNVDLDLTASISPGPLGVRGGMAPFRKAASDIAITCGCPGGVRFRETSIGRGTVTFMWSNLLERELASKDAPCGEYGRNAYGITDGGLPMSIKLGLHCLIVGMTGSGKSKTLRQLIVDLKRKSVQTDIYAMDPKRQEFSKFAALVNRSRGSLNFRGYENSVDGSGRMLSDLVDLMHERQDEMASAGLDEWEEKHHTKWPLALIAIDEVLELLAVWKPTGPNKINPKDHLTTILSQGRAAGVQVIMLSQVAHKEILGLSRSLVPQRVVLKMESALETGMAFGDQHAEDKGAKCSELQEPGMGYQWSAEVRGYAPFRAALVSNEDWERVLAGDELPVGMLEAGQVIEAPHFLYRFYTADRQPLRVGETNDFERRYKEYRRSYEKEAAQLEAGILDPAKALHQWFPYHDHSQTVVQECKNYADAKAQESAHIATGVWRGNHQENMKASLRNIAPPPPEAKPHFWQRPPKAVEPDRLPEPTNVTPITRSRPAPERIERRKIS